MWTPSNKEQKKLFDQAVRKAKITCQRHAQQQITCGELERLIVEKNWQEKLGLTDDESVYLRYIACGAWDRPLICSLMDMNKKQVSKLRAGCAVKLGISECSDMPQLFIQMVRVVGCGIDAEETRRENAAKKARRVQQKEESARLKAIKKFQAIMYKKSVYGYLPAATFSPCESPMSDIRSGMDDAEIRVKLQHVKIDGAPLEM